MRFIFNEDQILRLKESLKKTNINEDTLDDLIAKGKEYTDKAVKATADYINGLDTDVEKKSQDVPTKADFIGDDVEDFFKILESIDQPITEQKYGSMTHQQSVEAVQIGLQLLGYQLPKFGTDGLFGPETAAAVRKFKLDNSIVEEIKEAFVAIGDETDSNLKVDADTANDKVNDALIEDIKKAAESAGLTVTITTASTGHKKKTVTGNDSRHGFGTAVDISIINGVGKSDKNFKAYGDKLKDALVSMGYKWNVESGNDKAVLWQTNIGGNHYNHLHVSNKAGVSGSPSQSQPGGETITPNMVGVLIDELKAEGVTSDDLKKYIDPAVRTGGSAEFTDLNLATDEGKEAYKKICDSFINQRAPGSPVTGQMLANGATKAFQRYKKYVPAELALAQITLEGGLDAAPNSKPMRTKNPFNVGNTTDGKVKGFASFQDGVDAYYDLIARKYLVNGRTAKDLVAGFTNDEGKSYADSAKYESSLRGLIKTIRAKNEPVYAALAKQSSEKDNLAEALLDEADKRQVLRNTFGLSDDWANEFHNLSDKVSVWIADTFIKEMINIYRDDIPQGEDPKRYVVGLLNDQGPHGNDAWQVRFKPRYEYVIHWLRAPRREQVNIRELTLDAAYDLAQEWHDSLQIRKQTDYNETGDVFIDYRNDQGVGYYWVNLHTNYCSAEAERMGHCARANTPGSELISLRRINEFGEGESYLTVDYRPGGVLGDFHRHGNKKPTSRFHRQIVDFLINTTYPVTQLTSQGVHRYDENFHLSDLSQADLRRVLQGNPSLRFNINDEATHPEIINALIDGELDLASYSNEIRLKLFKKAISLNKGAEFKALFNDAMIVDFMDHIGSVRSEYKDLYIREFGQRLNDILTEKVSAVENHNEKKEMFIDSLREISQNLFDHYLTFCPYIDHMFKQFNEDEVINITSQRGVKKTLYSCSDVVPFLSRYMEHSPVDSNGNIAVKTEEGLWGLVKRSGEVVLHPQFLGITPYRMDTSGKTYLIKNMNSDFYTFNPETGDYKRFKMKS